MSAENKITTVQEFLARLNAEPNPSAIDKTPDGKASTVVISAIETTLDEMFLGMWSTKNFKTKVIANEVVGELELEVVHPITGHTITRTGAAAIQITVDKVPDEIKDNSQKKNMWALDPSNKKSNALDLTYPKLKAECTKNAAQTLGKIFGRDLNRKKTDSFKPAFGKLPQKAFEAMLLRIQQGEVGVIEKALAHFELTEQQIISLQSLKQLPNGTAQ